MAETTLLEKTAELVAKAQNNVSDASPHLAEGITKEATRFTPPLADGVMKMAGHVFDFAQRAPRDATDHGGPAARVDLDVNRSTRRRRATQVSLRAG
jgi:hypothetical protein